MPGLGEKFKERRRELGLSVAQAESDTRIRGRWLQLLEDGEYDQLPDPGYVRGYISSYAKYLELDPQAMLAMYHAETGKGRFHRIVPPEIGVVPRHEVHVIPRTAALVAVGVVAVIALVVWAIVTFSGKPQTPPPIQTPPAASDAQAGTGNQAAQPSDSPAAQVKPITTPPFTVRVSVAANGASWVRVTVDGKVAYEGTMTGGQTKEFQVTQSAALRIGKPSSVTVTKDGQPVKVKSSGGFGVITLTPDQQ
jgi:cytoskeletal protein RodZ